MKILLTNDDGVSSPCLDLLLASLRSAGHTVFALVPHSDRSGVSHAISFFSAPCKLCEIETNKWSCSGTPADCVVVALQSGVFPFGKPDLVISGINRGANLGTDLIYSGTAGAARQAGLLGIPALALSLVEADEWHWETAVSFAVEKLDEMRAAWKADTFVNVNFPNRAEPPVGIVPAFPSRRRYNDLMDLYKVSDKEVYCFTRGLRADAEPEAGSDCDIAAKNYAPLSVVYVHPLISDNVKETG